MRRIRLISIVLALAGDSTITKALPSTFVLLRTICVENLIV